MWVQLTRSCRVVGRAAALAAVGLCLVSTAGGVEVEGSARVDRYADDRIEVVSPAARLRVILDERFAVEGRYAVDALSGATPVITADAVSRATPFDETRHEADVGLEWRPEPTTTYSGGYAISAEPDYLTHRLRAGGAFEVLDRLAVVSAGVALGLERMGRTDVPDFEAPAQSYTVDLAWQHILARRTSATLALTGQAHDCDARVGCQANPYRYVAVVGEAGEIQAALPERHPDSRLRGSGRLSVAQGLGGGFALHGGYRLYADSWAMVAHTFDLGLAADLWAQRISLRLEGRGTEQGGASFHRSTYAADLPSEPGTGSVPRWRSADRELGALRALGAGGRAEVTLVGVRLNVRVMRLWYHYLEGAIEPTRDAWLVGAGLAVER